MYSVFTVAAVTEDIEDNDQNIIQYTVMSIYKCTVDQLGNFQKFSVIALLFSISLEYSYPRTQTLHYRAIKTAS